MDKLIVRLQHFFTEWADETWRGSSLVLALFANGNQSPLPQPFDVCLWVFGAGAV
jgi:hypothetical protein